MNDAKTSLSARYYVAEATIWVLGGILLVSHFVGLAPNQPLPLLHVKLENTQYFPKIVAALLACALLYLFVEWKQCSREKRSAGWVVARLIATVLFACISFWLTHSLIAHDTRFEGISPAWYFGFIIIGFLIGTFVSIVALSALMIRNPEEAEKIRLPRIPAATRAQFVGALPLVTLLMGGYYVMLYFSPNVLHGFSSLLVIIPFLVILQAQWASLFLARDENSDRIPYAQRIAQFRKIYDVHDYGYFLDAHGERISNKLQIPSTGSPHDAQKAMQQRFSVSEGDMPFHLHIQLKEEIHCLLFSKDGDPSNDNPQNRGVRIRKLSGKKEMLRVLLIPDEPGEESRELEIPILHIETYAEEYLSNHTKQAELTIKKVLSYAINQTMIDTLIKQAGPPLCRAAMAGNEDVVRKLIPKSRDINESFSFGWTPLLSAAAQGYPAIMRMLLDAGANPDIGNVHGITSLMYGARYGNMDVCRVLLEYGAILDIQDVYGMTALIVASRDGHLPVVELLLQAGADPSIKTQNGRTALDFAHACKLGQIAKRLRRANKSIQAAK